MWVNDSPGRERHQRPECLQFQEVGVRERLEGAAEIRVIAGTARGRRIASRTARRSEGTRPRCAVEGAELLRDGVGGILPQHQVPPESRHRSSARFVKAHMTSGLVGASISGCVPRGGNPWMPCPPGAIMVSAHGARRYGWLPALRMRCMTSTPDPSAAIRTVICFSSPVSGSTGSVRDHASSLTSIATGALSGA